LGLRERSWFSIMLERLAVKWGWGGQTTSFAPDVILSAGYVNEWSIFLSQSRSQKFNRRTLWKIAQNRKRSFYIYLFQCFNKMIHTYGEKNDWWQDFEYRCKIDRKNSRVLDVDPNFHPQALQKLYAWKQTTGYESKILYVQIMFMTLTGFHFL